MVFEVVAHLMDLGVVVGSGRDHDVVELDMVARLGGRAIDPDGAVGRRGSLDIGKVDVRPLELAVFVLAVLVIEVREARASVSNIA